MLAELAAFGHRFSIPQYLSRPEKYSDKRSQGSALIIQLAQQGWDQPTGKALAKYTLELATDNAEMLNRALMAIDTNRIVGLPIEAYLLELLNNTPNSEWLNKMRILDALENSLRHRTSHLLETWEELGLPRSLKRLIQA